MSGNSSQEQENLQFNEYYEEPVKPRDALEYLKNSIEGAKAEKEEIAKLTSENDDLKKEAELKEMTSENDDLKKIEELEKKEAELKEKIMEATTLRPSETTDKMEEMGVADPPVNTAGMDDSHVGTNDTAAVADATVTTAAVADALIDTNDIAMETPAAAEVSATAVHEAFNQKKDEPVEEALETQDVTGAETPTINGHTAEDEVAEAPSMEVGNMVGNINSVLPNELLEILLGLLPHRDRKSAVLVCKLWKKNGEGSILWTWVKLLVTSGNLADMPEIICLSRLAKVGKITLEAISNEVLEAIEKHQGLKLLNIYHCNVSDIDSDLLASVITRIEEVHLNGTRLNKKQWNDIFNAMSNDATLKKLNISFTSSLSAANPQSLATAISTLEVVKLDYSGLTSEQSKAMFELLASKSKLKSLEIVGNDLSSVAGQTLAMVVSKVEEATLDFARLTTEQCSAIFGFAAGNSKLKILDISRNDLSSVNQYDMAKAVNNMEKINLDLTNLTNQQCNQIFKYAEIHSNLKVLNIGHNDLRSLESGSIAKTVSKMEECKLGKSKLTSQQLDAIFKQLSEDSKLKKLDIHEVNLSSFEGNVISKAIANLEEVNLSETHLTTQQLEAVFTEIKSSRKLKILGLSYVDLRSVQIDSLVGALGCLEVVDLREAWLTPEQVAVIKSIPEGCRPKVKHRW